MQTLGTRLETLTLSLEVTEWPSATAPEPHSRHGARRISRQRRIGQGPMASAGGLALRTLTARLTVSLRKKNQLSTYSAFKSTRVAGTMYCRGIRMISVDGTHYQRFGTEFLLQQNELGLPSAEHQRAKSRASKLLHLPSSHHRLGKWLTEFWRCFLMDVVAFTKAPSSAHSGLALARKKWSTWLEILRLQLENMSMTPGRSKVVPSVHVNITSKLDYIVLHHICMACFGCLWSSSLLKQKNIYKNHW